MRKIQICSILIKSSNFADSIPQFLIIPRLKKLIQKDSTYFEPYNSLVDLLMLSGKESDPIGYINQAFRRELSRIVDKNGNWPDGLKWSII